MSMATKCVDIDTQSGAGVEVHRFKDGMMQLHAIKDMAEEGPFDGEWQVCTLTESEARQLIWGLQHALGDLDD